MINIDERYGERVEVTIEDYQSLNPSGDFEEKEAGIWERFSDQPGDYVVVAVLTKEQGI